MRQHMPGDPEERDCGTRQAEWPHVLPEPSYVQEIVRQGKHRPRLLSPEERRTAQKNRKEAREEAEQWEQWAAAELGMAPLGGRYLMHSDEYIPEPDE